MENKDKIFYILSFIILFITLYVIGYKNGYGKGYVEGGKFGVDLAFDTIQTVMRNQIKSDSTISDVTIVVEKNQKYDTLQFFLSKKIFK